MRFSDEFNVEETADNEWFNPYLTIDSRLFVDPFLVYQTSIAEFQDAHDEVIDYFQSVFTLTSRFLGSESNKVKQKAISLLTFPEVEEACLGYTQIGRKGSGSGKGRALQIFDLIIDSLKKNSVDLEHIEELLLFEERIGPDLISDITLNILFHRFANYTRNICKSLGIDTQQFGISRLSFQPEERRWAAGRVALPPHPQDERGIILVPKEFLRPLPNLGPEDFASFVDQNYPSLVSNEFGDDVLRKLSKRNVKNFKEKYPDIFKAFLEQKKVDGGSSYNFLKDDLGLNHLWYQSLKIAESNPLPAAPKNLEALLDFVIESFQNYIENQMGWSLLWSDDKPRAERYCQTLFYGLIKHYCAAHKIIISREPNIGRGPVDFKLSRAFDDQAVIEVKLAKNTKFWSGLRKQLPKYCEAEELSLGYYLVICFSDKDLNRSIEAENTARSISQRTGISITVKVIDARKCPKSASLL
jgi:hypothetical protein